MPDEKKQNGAVRVSPISGTPAPVGRPFEKGDPRASLAGKKSQEVQRRKRSLKNELIDLLEESINNKEGKPERVQRQISTALIAKALNGDTKAFEIIRDTIGEKPVDKVEAQQVTVDLSHMTTEEIKAILDEDTENVE